MNSVISLVAVLWSIFKTVVFIFFLLAVSSEECLRSCAKCEFWLSYACAEYHSGFFSPFIRFVVSCSNDYVSGQVRPGSDCADAQAELCPRCLRMPDDTVSHDAVYISCAATLENVPFDMCAKRRRKSACVSSQSAQSLRCPHEETFHPWLSKCSQLRIWSDCTNTQTDLHLRWRTFQKVPFLTLRPFK